MSESNNRQTKVVRVMDEYDLTGMGPRLEAAWTGESGERTSLRDLADEFNETVLEEALREAGNSPLGFEVSGTYETLSSNSDADATRVRRRLKRKGVDVDKVESDFVTHQAIHTYLRKNREASLPEEDGDRREQKIKSIEKLRSRLTAVAESAFSSLAAADELNHDDYDVLTNIQAVCPDCGADHPVGELVQQGGCDCKD